METEYASHMIWFQFVNTNDYRPSVGKQTKDETPYELHIKFTRNKSIEHTIKEDEAGKTYQIEDYKLTKQNNEQSS